MAVSTLTNGSHGADIPLLQAASFLYASLFFFFFFSLPSPALPATSHIPAPLEARFCRFQKCPSFSIGEHSPVLSRVQPAPAASRDGHYRLQPSLLMQARIGTSRPALRRRDNDIAQNAKLHLLPFFPLFVFLQDARIKQVQ